MRMMIVDLRLFLTTGGFGELGLNCTETDVRLELGEPENITVDSCDPAIWKYGNVEVTFEHGHVISIELTDPLQHSWETIYLSEESKSLVATLTPGSFWGSAQKLWGGEVVTKTSEYLPGTTIIYLPQHMKIVFEGDHITSVSVLKR